jgi:hypothetical protein
MLGKLAWLKVVAENRHTIFKLIREAVFGRRERAGDPKRDIPYEDVASQEASG